MASYLIPIFILSITLFSFFSKNNSYSSFISGCEEGIKSFVKICPYIISMYFATSLLLKSNIMYDLFSNFNTKYVDLFIQGLFRPLSSSAALSVMNEIFLKYGVDSHISLASSILQGSTDTTIYIVTIYYGSIGIKKFRHTLLLGLIVDIISFISAIVISFYLM